MADALAYIHSEKMNHLDVKPGNILLNDRDEAVLIDFGLSKQYDALTGSQTSTTPVGISEGYAPMEQYKQGGVGEFSPETDIYALGATFFKLLTGKTPPSASDVFEDGVPVEDLKSKGVSQTVISLICEAMEPKKKDRLNDVQDFVKKIKGRARGTQTKHKSKKMSSADEETRINPMRKENEMRRAKNTPNEMPNHRNSRGTTFLGTEGRIGVKDYIFVSVGGFFVTIFLLFLFVLAFPQCGIEVGMIIFYMPYLVIVFSAGAKRSHDIGHSGWYQVIPFVNFNLLCKEGDSKDNAWGTIKDRGFSREAVKRTLVSIGVIAFVLFAVALFNNNGESGEINDDSEVVGSLDHRSN